MQISLQLGFYKPCKHTKNHYNTFAIRITSYNQQHYLKQEYSSMQTYYGLVIRKYISDSVQRCCTLWSKMENTKINRQHN
jgi:hypothetical protein